MSPIRSLIPALCAIAIVGGTGYAFAQSSASTTTNADSAGAPHATGRHGFRPHGHDGGFMYGHILKQLNVTADQRTQIKAILTQERPQVQALAKSSRENRQAMLAASPNDSSYQGLVATAQSNASARVQLMADIQRQIYGVLTPEQQAQIPGIVAAQEAAMKQRWSGRHTAS